MRVPAKLAPAIILVAVMLASPKSWADDAAPAAVPDPPKGWTKKDDGGNAVYRPDGLAAGQDMQVIILPGDTNPGDFRKWFDEKVKKFQAGKTAVKTTEPHAHDLQGTSGLMQAIVCKDDDAAADDKTAAKHFLFRTYLAANPTGRAEMIVLSVTSNDVLKKYTPGYQELTTRWAAIRVAKKAEKKEEGISLEPKRG